MADDTSKDEEEPVFQYNRAGLDNSGRAYTNEAMREFLRKWKITCQQINPERAVSTGGRARDDVSFSSFPLFFITSKMYAFHPLQTLAVAYVPYVGDDQVRYECGEPENSYNVLFFPQGVDGDKHDSLVSKLFRRPPPPPPKNNKPKKTPKNQNNNCISTIDDSRAGQVLTRRMMPFYLAAKGFLTRSFTDEGSHAAINACLPSSSSLWIVGPFDTKGRMTIVAGVLFKASTEGTLVEWMHCLSPYDHLGKSIDLRDLSYESQLCPALTVDEQMKLANDTQVNITGRRLGLLLMIMIQEAAKEAKYNHDLYLQANVNSYSLSRYFFYGFSYALQHQNEEYFPECHDFFKELPPAVAELVHKGDAHYISSGDDCLRLLKSPRLPLAELIPPSQTISSGPSNVNTWLNMHPFPPPSLECGNSLNQAHIEGEMTTVEIWQERFRANRNHYVSCAAKKSLMTDETVSGRSDHMVLGTSAAYGVLFPELIAQGDDERDAKRRMCREEGTIVDLAVKLPPLEMQDSGSSFHSAWFTLMYDKKCRFKTLELRHFFSALLDKYRMLRDGDQLLQKYFANLSASTLAQELKHRSLYHLHRDYAPDDETLSILYDLLLHDHAHPLDHKRKAQIVSVTVARLDHVTWRSKVLPEGCHEDLLKDSWPWRVDFHPVPNDLVGRRYYKDTVVLGMAICQDQSFIPLFPRKYSLIVPGDEKTPQMTQLCNADRWWWGRERCIKTKTAIHKRRVKLQAVYRFYRLEANYVSSNFKEDFIQRCRDAEYAFLPIPVGKARDTTTAEQGIFLPQQLSKHGSNLSCKFQQQMKPLCLLFSFASALYASGMRSEAIHVANSADYFFKSGHDVNTFYAIVRKACPFHTLIRFKKAPLFDEKPELPIAAILLGNDGTSDHAVAIWKDMLFDSTERDVLDISKANFDALMGPCGFHGIKRAWLLVKNETIQPSLVKKLKTSPC